MHLTKPTPRLTTLALPWIACATCGACRPASNPCRHLTAAAPVSPWRTWPRQGVLYALSFALGAGAFALGLGLGWLGAWVGR